MSTAGLQITLGPMGLFRFDDVMIRTHDGPRRNRVDFGLLVCKKVGNY